MFEEGKTFNLLNEIVVGSNDGVKLALEGLLGPCKMLQALAFPLQYGIDLKMRHQFRQQITDEWNKMVKIRLVCESRSLCVRYRYQDNILTKQTENRLKVKNHTFMKQHL